jgi:hypothetical protein
MAIMKKKSLVILSILGLFLISLPLMPNFFIRIRGDNVDVVCNAWMKADKNWNNGNYVNALGETLQALWMTIDFESRILISRPFYRRALVLEKQGQLIEAINLCWTGAKIIGQYDMEGESAYYCNELEMQYQNTLPNSTSVSPTVTP